MALHHDIDLIKQIADRAVTLYERHGIKVKREFIMMELRLVHEELCALRLADLLASDEANFAHDIGGIHRHIVIGKNMRFEPAFCPRFAAR